MENELFHEAIADFNRALELDPQYPHVLVNRGMVKYELNDLNGSLEDLMRAVAADPGYAYAYYFRGVLYAELGEIEAAIADLAKCIESTDDPWRYSHSRYRIPFWSPMQPELDYGIIVFFDLSRTKSHLRLELCSPINQQKHKALMFAILLFGGGL